MPLVLLGAIHVAAWLAFIVSGFLDQHLDISLPFGEPLSAYVLLAVAPFVFIVSFFAGLPRNSRLLRSLIWLSLLAFGLLWIISVIFIVAEKVFGHQFKGT